MSCAILRGVAAALLVVASAGFAAFDGASINASLNATAAPDHILLTWSSDPSTTQTISWRTRPGIDTGYVKYREAGAPNSAARKQAASHVRFSTAPPDSPGSMVLHAVTLTGLKPDTRYSYAVFSDSTSRGPFEFTTAPDAERPFSFLLFGDSQSGDIDKPDYSTWHATVQAAFDRTKDARFMISVGDLVEAGLDYRHWNNWFDAARDVLERIPAMPVEGNHETEMNAKPDRTGAPLAFIAQFPVFENGPEGLKRQGYSYDVGNAHFVVLDSQQDEESGASGDVLTRQVAWLDKDLAATTKTWKIALFHKTPYYCKAVRANESLKAAFCPVIDKYHVDVVFNGHDHCLARTFPLRAGRLFASPKDGPVYYVTGRSGAKTYADVSMKIWDAFFFNPKDQPCYTKASVDGKRMTLTAYNLDGTTIDTYTIDKGDYAKCTVTAAPGPFEAPALIAYGSVLAPDNPARPAIARDARGKWCVDVTALLPRLGGSASVEKDTVTLSLGKKVCRLPVDASAAGDHGGAMVTAGNLTSGLGLSCRFDDGLNALYVAK